VRDGARRIAHPGGVDKLIEIPGSGAVLGFAVVVVCTSALEAHPSPSDLDSAIVFSVRVALISQIGLVHARGNARKEPVPARRSFAPCVDFHHAAFCRMPCKGLTKTLLCQRCLSIPTFLSGNYHHGIPEQELEPCIGDRRFGLLLYPSSKAQPGQVGNLKRWHTTGKEQTSGGNTPC
jgi:hypothetical protein